MCLSKDNIYGWSAHLPACWLFVFECALIVCSFDDTEDDVEDDAECDEEEYQVDFVVTPLHDRFEISGLILELEGL